MKKKLFLLLVSLSMVQLLYASGLFNKYKIYSYDSYEYSVGNATVRVDMAPTEYRENGVIIMGSPYAFRMVCRSQQEGECNVGLQYLKIRNDSGTLVTLDDFEWRRFSTNKAFYQSLIIEGLAAEPDGGDVCVEINMDSEGRLEFCMEFSVSEESHFFLFDRWNSI